MSADDDQRFAEVIELVSDLYTGGLDAKRHARLDTLLATDDRALKIYVEYLDMHVELALQTHPAPADAEIAETLDVANVDSIANTNTSEKSEPSEPASRTRAKSWLNRASKRPVRPALAIAMLVMISVLTWMGVTTVKNRIAANGDNKGKDEQREPAVKSDYVAKLTDWHNPVWLEDTQPPMRYPQLKVGKRLVIESGLIEITYKTGARVVIEGPAEFEVEGKRGGWLESGSLTARVVSTSGKVSGEGANSAKFAIDTPWAKVVDLGTEFGVRVAAGRTHVRVFDGRVKIITYGENGSEDDQAELTEGQYAATDDLGAISEVTTVSNGAPAFIRSMPDVYALPPGLKTNAYRELVKAENPVAFWPLDDRDENVLTDIIGERIAFAYGALRSPDPKDPAHEPGTLLFDGRRSYAKATFDAKLNTPAFTIEAWVRPHPEGEGHRAVMTSREDLVTTGIAGYVLYITPENHWALWLGGSMGPNRGNDWQQLAGPPARLARWIHVVATFEPKATQHKSLPFSGTARLYINGQMAAEQPLRYRPNVDQSLFLGGVLENNSDPNYFFHGNLSNIAVYDRVLTDRDVRAHYDAATGVSIDSATSTEETQR